MAKPHKFAWNGIDVETSLSIEQLANMAQRAAQECTGDLLHGKHRIASVKSTDRQIEFRINDFLITFKKFMVFHLDFEVKNGRTWMSSRIAWYVTTQPTVGGFIPAGTKSMVGHHTYMQFAHHLAGQVRSADPQARVTLREGVAATAVPPAQPARTAPVQEAAAPVSTTAPAVPPAPAASNRVGVPLPPPPLSAGFAGPPPPPPPPGMVPAARTPPRPSAAAPRTVPPSTGLVTSVPGMPQREASPVPSVEVQPAGFASLAEQLFAEDEELFHTRMVQSGVDALPWVLRLAEGREVPLQSSVVLGRNPTVPASHADAAALSVDDPYRSVSKTHAMVELRNGLPWVSDLHSTNGTTLTNDVGEAVACEPGSFVPVGDGWTLGLGEYSVTIVRRGVEN